PVGAGPAAGVPRRRGCPAGAGPSSGGERAAGAQPRRGPGELMAGEAVSATELDEVISMSNPQLVAVVIAGGSGTRFWPVSTEDRPKQFLPLFGPRTLLQATVDRLEGLVPPERILVVTAARF